MGSSLRERFDRVLSITLALLIGVMVLLVGYQVFARYLPFVPAIGWTEEVSRGCFIWMVMMGAGLGVLHGTHFSIEVLITKLSPRVQHWIRTFDLFVILIISIIFVFHGWGFFMRGFHRVSLVTGLPVAWTYGSILIAGLCMVLLSGEGIYRRIRDFVGPSRKSDRGQTSRTREEE